MSQGVLRAFKGQLIHTFNKREGALTHAAAAAGQPQGRGNVLLLGDSLGDLTMADGVSEHRNILTIGFLNDQVCCSYAQTHGSFRAADCSFGVSQVEERKESYVNSFDIVLVKDETLDVPNAVLRSITQPGAANATTTHKKDEASQVTR